MYVCVYIYIYIYIYLFISGNTAYRAILQGKFLHRDSPSSEFIKDILICVPKINEGLTGLEWHEGE